MSDPSADIAKVLISEEEIRRRVGELAAQVQSDFAGRDLVFTKELKLDVANRDVLLVDDILDTGKTLRAVINKLGRMTPRQVRTCVLLSKKARREYDIPADYIGFEIPDEFVVGYGLDYAEKYRNLPHIGVLKPELYS